MNSQHTTIFLDGAFLPSDQTQLSLKSQTLHYGNGVFEGIRAYQTLEEGTAIFKAEAHFTRLIKSAKKVHIPFDYSVEELTHIAYLLLEKNKLKDAYIRPLVYTSDEMSLRPANESHLLMMAWQWGKYLSNDNCRVMISSYQRPHPKAFPMDVKLTGMYANSILATKEAQQKGFDEALLCDSLGFVAEGSGQNFFFEKDRTLYTPPLGNILPGITRSTIIDLAKHNGTKVVEKHFTPEELCTADSAFFTGTATEVAGIHSVDDYVFPMNWEDSLGYMLQQEYQQKVRQENFQTYTII